MLSWAVEEPMSLEIAVIIILLAIIWAVVVLSLAPAQGDRWDSATRAASRTLKEIQHQRYWRNRLRACRQQPSLRARMRRDLLKRWGNRPLAKSRRIVVRHEIRMRRDIAYRQRIEWETAENLRQHERMESERQALIKDAARLREASTRR
jgi:hypothetical protein